jgi:hypothetical protein
MGIAGMPWSICSIVILDGIDVHTLRLRQALRARDSRL